MVKKMKLNGENKRTIQSTTCYSQTINYNYPSTIHKIHEATIISHFSFSFINLNWLLIPVNPIVFPFFFIYNKIQLLFFIRLFVIFVCVTVSLSLSLSSIIKHTKHEIHSLFLFSNNPAPNSLLLSTFH